MKRLPLFLAVACLAVLPARAADAPVTHDFLAAGAIDYHKLLPPPPADDSVPGHADEEIAAQLDAHRTPEQAVLAKHYEKFSVFILLQDILGPECNAQNLPRTAAFFKQALTEARPIVDEAKAEWNRKRPYIFNPALHPAVDKPDNASYPSGHAYGSSLVAVLLAAALPEQTDEWMKAAALVRWSRLVGGAHYPNDVVSGQILGEAVAKEMLKSPKLQKTLEEVRAELLPHLKKKAA